MLGGFAVDSVRSSMELMDPMPAGVTVSAVQCEGRWSNVLLKKSYPAGLVHFDIAVPLTSVADVPCVAILSNSLERTSFGMLATSKGTSVKVPSCALMLNVPCMTGEMDGIEASSERLNSVDSGQSSASEGSES